MHVCYLCLSPHLYPWGIVTSCHCQLVWKWNNKFMQAFIWKVVSIQHMLDPSQVLFKWMMFHKFLHRSSLIHIDIHIDTMRSVRSSPGLWWGLADSDLLSVNVSADVRIVLSTGCQRKKDGRKAKCLQGRKDHQDFSEAQWEQDHPQSCDKVKGQQAHHPVLCFSLHLHLRLLETTQGG